MTESTLPTPPLASADAEAAVALALALVESLAELGLGDAAPAAYLDTLAALAEAEGLRCQRLTLSRGSALVARPRVAAAGPFPSARGIGLGAALTAPKPGAAELGDALLPSGIWGACLAIATAACLGRSGGSRLVALVQAEGAAADEAASRAGEEALGEAIAGLHLVVAGDGGVPYHDGSQIVMPITIGQRGALWFELDASAAPGAPDDLSVPREAGVAERLLAAIAAMPQLPAGEGRLFRDIVAAHRRRASGEIADWLDGLADGARRPSLLAQAGAVGRYLRGTLEPTWSVTRLDVGSRIDRAAASGRAVIDVRVPADARVAEVRATLEAAVAERPALAQVNSRVRWTREGLCAATDNPVRAALTRALDEAGLPLSVVPEQARREQAGRWWEQGAVPVLGLTPAWIDTGVDVEAGRNAGVLPVTPGGLRWGATVFVRVAELLDGRAG